MIVVQHDGAAVAGAPKLARYRLGDGLVDRQIAVLPGVQRLAADVGAIQPVPKRVLEEPEDGIAERAVEEVVGFLRRGDESKARALADLQRCAAQGDLAIGGAGGARYPA